MFTNILECPDMRLLTCIAKQANTVNLGFAILIQCSFLLQVPAIETSKGFRLVQSQAIIHYIGRATGMDCDCEDMHQCEVVALGAG